MKFSITNEKWSAKIFPKYYNQLISHDELYEDLQLWASDNVMGDILESIYVKHCLRATEELREKMVPMAYSVLNQQLWYYSMIISTWNETRYHVACYHLGHNLQRFIIVSQFIHQGAWPSGKPFPCKNRTKTHLIGSLFRQSTRQNINCEKYKSS